MRARPVLLAALLCVGCALSHAVLPGERRDLGGGAFAALGGGGNSLAVRTRAGLVVVDPKWLLGVDDVKKLAHAAGAPVRWLVDTHWHPDHSAGRAAFPGARLIAAGGVGLDPQLEVRGDRALDLGGEPVQLFLFAAHTRGDVVAYFPARGLLATGDLVMTGYVGHVDGGSWRAWLAALERLAALPVRVVVPGHGELAGPEELVRQRDLLRAAFAGASAEELRRRFGLGDFPAVSSVDTLVAQVAAERR